MKHLFIYLAILSTLGAQAQKLQLRKGQKFTGEYLDINNQTHSTAFKFLNYDAYEFEVIKAKDSLYEMKVQLDRHIGFNSFDRKLFDTALPSEGKERNIAELSDRALTRIPFILTVSNNGNIIRLSGLEQVREKLLKQIADKPLPESIYEMKDEDYINIRFAASFYNSMAKAFFKMTPLRKIDTTYTENEAGKFADTTLIKKETIVDPLTGLTILYYTDSLSTGKYLDKDIRHNESYATWYSLKSSNIWKLNSGPDLLLKLSEHIDLKAESSLQKRLAASLDDLKRWYESSKGKLGIDELTRQKLDSLEQYIRPDDHDFWASEAELLAYFDYEGKRKLIDRLPAEALLSDASVAEKAKLEYEHRNTPGFLDALKLMFSKFAQNGDYPSNAEHIAILVHYQICKDVFESSDRNDLLRIQKMVDGVKQLNIPKLTSIFDGITPYLAAKLAKNTKDLEPITNKRFSSIFDNYGRYRLLIYDRMTSLKVPDSARAAYLDYSIEMFRSSIEEILKPAEREGREKFFFDFHIKPNRITLRKQLADAYYRKSILEPEHALKYLQLATDYLPSQEDLIEGKYMVEREYPYLPEKNYTELYMEAAGSKGASPDEMLKKYVDMVILEPERYVMLKEKYLKLHPQGDFKSFFSRTLKEKLPASPGFKLADRNGKVLNNKDEKGKYIFIDFWGTWCGACVAEIDKIEALHLNNPDPEKLMVTTIACHDKKNLVDEFMEKKKFSYQVLMSDNQVEKNFKVRSYPTKLLLLPNEVYLVIPYSADYNAVIRKYTSWEL